MSVTRNTKVYLAILTALIFGLALGWAGGGISQSRQQLKPGLGDGFQLLRSLDSEQRQKLKEVRRGHRQRMQGMVADLRTVGQEFNDAIENRSDLSRLREIYSRLLKLREQRDWAQFEMISEIIPELRQEQLKHLRLNGPRGPGSERRALKREQNREGL